MTKPFETKALVEKLKAKGLDVAEELAEVLATEVLDWTIESCAMHENTFVKMGAPIIMAVKPIVLSQIDKIDGKIGQ